MKACKNFRDKKTFNWEEEFPEVFKQGGFDVIIGNPPYVDSESMVKKFPEDRQFISKKYIAAKGNWDLYIPFWELAFKLLKNEGVASYITPNKWVSIKYGESLRKLLFSHLIKICNLTNIKVFAAGNSPIVVFINKGVSSKTIGIETINSDIKIQHTGNVQKVLIENDDWGLLLSTYPRLVTKLMTFGKISDFLSVENPFTVSEAYDLKKILTDGNYKKGFLKFINTGTIDRYACLWGIKSTTYLKEKYQTPVVNRKDFARLFSKRYKQISLPKIITSGMRNFDSLLDERGNMLAGKSTIIIKPKSNKESLYFFLGVLNSKLISFYIKQKYSALGIDGGINFTTELIRNLPEPNYKGIIKLQIESDVRKIIDLKSKLSNYEADSEKWSSLKSEIEKTDRKIDEEVYKLYNLTSEEIRIVEKS